MKIFIILLFVQINYNENTIKDIMITNNNRFNQVENLIIDNMNNNINSINQIET